MSRKQLTGTVISNQQTNTVTVEVSHLLPHPRYGKRIKKRKKFYAHCEFKVEAGDTVIIEETRPLSKTKNWRVVEIIS